MKSINLQPRLLCPAKILFRIEGEIKKFLETKSSSSPNHYYMKYLRDLFKKNKKIKTMNIKMAINSQLSTIECKKQTKQTSRTGTDSDMEIIWRVISWKGKEEKGRNGARGQEA